MCMCLLIWAIYLMYKSNIKIIQYNVENNLYTDINDQAEGSKAFMNIKHGVLLEKMSF